MREPDAVAKFFPAPGLVVERTENAVFIDGTMELSGPEATPDRALSVQGWINASWTKSFPDGSSVLCHVVVRYRPQGTAAGPVTQITAKNMLRSSYWSRESLSMTLNATRTGAFGWTAAHEFGHALGMMDRYYESDASKQRDLEGGPRETTPHPGYERNMMAEVGGLLEAKNLADLASENTKGWFHQDAQVLSWLNSHSNDDISRLSPAGKVKAIKSLMTGWITDEDVAAIVRICLSSRSKAEADFLDAGVNLRAFSSVRQRTIVSVALLKMKYSSFAPQITLEPIQITLVPPQVTLAQGDTLSGLAAKYYGAAEYWPLIWDANRDAVGLNPNQIKLGAVLKLPPPGSFSAAQVQDAKRRHGSWRSNPHGTAAHHHSGSAKTKTHK